MWFFRLLGAQEMSRFATHTFARSKGLNLTVASWFHYGLAEEKEQWYGPHLKPAENNPPPFFLEERMGDVFEPDLAEIGEPDLIILQSIYWDLRYFPYHATQYGWSWELQRVTRPMTWTELAWHRARLTDYVRLFQDRFPGVPIMFRLGELSGILVLLSLSLTPLSLSQAKSAPTTKEEGTSRSTR